MKAEPNWVNALSDVALREEAGSGVFQRGQTYAASGAVQDPELSYPKDGANIALLATVKGTQLYTAQVLVNEDDGVQGDCDCPHGQEGYFCKHQVALALTLRGLLGGDAPVHSVDAQKKVAAAAKRAQTQASNREALRTFVQGQSVAVLADRLWQWAEFDRGLMAELKAWAAQSQASDDPKSQKTVISELLKSSGFLDWRESGVYAHRAEKVLPMLEQALLRDPAQARALCEHALRRLYKAGEEADDSNGEIGDLMHSVMDLLLRSLQAAPPPAQWLDGWFALMEADPWGLWNEAEVVKAAGPQVQQRYSQRVQQDWQAWLDAQAIPSVSGAARPVRAEATVHSGGFDYQRFKLRKRYLDDLRRQGDPLAVIEAMRASMASASEHSELVAYCESVGKEREALQYAQAACKQFPKDLRCEADLLRCYERDGWDAEALLIRRRQLEKSPSVEHYRAVLKAAQAAGCEPQAYRAELYAWAAVQETVPRASYPSAYLRGIQAAATSRNVSTRVDWLLSEAKLDEALTLVQAPHACDPGLLHKLARQLKARPGDALPLLLQVFDFEMPKAATPYKEVLALAQEVADHMEQTRRRQWLAGLRAQYRAKRNFIKGLEALEI